MQFIIEFDSTSKEVMDQSLWWNWTMKEVFSSEVFLQEKVSTHFPTHLLFFSSNFLAELPQAKKLTNFIFSIMVFRNKKFSRKKRNLKTLKASSSKNNIKFTNRTYWNVLPFLFCWLSKDIIDMLSLLLFSLASFSLTCCIAEWQPPMIKRKNV